MEMLRPHGPADRPDAGARDGIHVLRPGADPFTIGSRGTTGRPMTAQGPTEITADLYRTPERHGAHIVGRVEDVAMHGADTDEPRAAWSLDGEPHAARRDSVGVCDGFHGVSRRTLPEPVRTEYERV